MVKSTPAANVSPSSEPMGPFNRQYNRFAAGGTASTYAPKRDYLGEIPFQTQIGERPAGFGWRQSVANEMSPGLVKTADEMSAAGGQNIKVFDAGKGRSMVVADPNNTLGVNSEVQAPVNLFRNPGNQQQADQSAAALASPAGQALAKSGVLRASPEEVNLLSRMRGGIPPGSYSPKDSAAQAENRNRLFQTADEANTRQQRLAEIAANGKAAEGVEGRKGKTAVEVAEIAMEAAYADLNNKREDRKAELAANRDQTRFMYRAKMADSVKANDIKVITSSVEDGISAASNQEPGGLEQSIYAVKAAKAIGGNPSQVETWRKRVDALTRSKAKTLAGEDKTRQEAIYNALIVADGNEDDPRVAALIQPAK
jgi:hypothetical protein